MYFLDDWKYNIYVFFFFQAEDGIRDLTVTGVQTCALPISCGGSGIRAQNPPCRNLCRRPPLRAPFLEPPPASPVRRSARPCLWLPKRGCSQLIRCDSPPADFRCSSTSPPCPRLCAPAGLPDHFSIRASGCSASPHENPRWDFRDPPAETHPFCPSAENFSGWPTLPAACHPR